MSNKKAPNRVAILQGDQRPDFLRDELLCEIFTQSAQMHGDKIALSCESKTYTYAQVESFSNKIAQALISQGIGVRDVVGLWMPRGAEAIIAQIAISKIGAAWLPFDTEIPLDRLSACLKDANAKSLLTSESFSGRLEQTDLPCRPAIYEAAENAPDKNTTPRAQGLTPQDPAYLIYTSGSTGTPKGIVITHANICHFLRSANSIYGINSSDVVFQGASLAFDLSMEEIWIPLMVGATLEIATSNTLSDIERLPDLLSEKGITVMDTVPTLLALLPKDVPSLRLILFGGEALPAPLAERWNKAGRRIFNTYGPTEATVVATVDEVTSGKTITIGAPIPNYSCVIVDENLTPVGMGIEGELLIGGPGIARSYLNRPELSAEKFIANPLMQHLDTPVLYRSGDAVSMNAEGKIIFHGRIDDQVKIRGFRVELGEIEARLVAFDEIAQAAVVMRHDNGIDRLVAFLVLENAEFLDSNDVRMRLKDQLPAYMLPAHVEILTALPMLSSGKVDRKNLKTCALTKKTVSETQEAPETPTEAALLKAAHQIFGEQVIPFEGDFFSDLGGHSLLAARFVSSVRENPTLNFITLQDIYAERTLRRLGALLDQKQLTSGGVQDFSFTPPPLWKRFFCGLAQAAVMPIIFGLLTAQWLGVFVSYMLITGEGASVWQEMATLMLVYVCINITTFFISIGGKWLILGRTKPGRYPLWGVYYYRWWLAQRLMKITKAKLFQGSFMAATYNRMLGAKIGCDVYVCEIESGAPDLISIGDNTSLGGKLRFANVEVIGNELIIGSVEIGRDVMIGTSAVIGRDVRIHDGAEISDMACISHGTTVGALEKWDGSPAKKVGTVDQSKWPEPAEASQGLRFGLNTLTLLLLIIIPPIGLIPLIPAFYVFDKLDLFFGSFIHLDYFYYLLLLAWPTAMALIVIEVLLIVAVRWLILPQVKSGTTSIYSGFYMRKWAVGLMTEVVLDTLTSLYATVYMRTWYRMMGAKIGKGSEVSINLAGRYDLVEIGANNFIADEVILAEEEIQRGWMTLKPLKTGDQVFVGNESVIAPGTSIGNGTLIGVKSKPASLHVGENETWFGIPTIQFPNRQTYGDVAANWTYEPPLWRKTARAVFEALHTSMPMALFLSLGTITVEIMTPYVHAKDYGMLALIFLSASILISATVVSIVCGIKWLLMGIYHPVIKPMWSWWAMRTEAVAVMCWGLSGKIVLEHLKGTPFIGWSLRPFGMKVGKGVFIDTTDFTEFDCMEVGDYCALNSFMALQTHLYEDRVMKVGRIKLGKGVSVGCSSVILYDTSIGDYARLGPQTVVMKGESIPAHSSWEGAPAVPAR